VVWRIDGIELKRKIVSIATLNTLRRVSIRTLRRITKMLIHKMIKERMVLGGAPKTIKRYMAQQGGVLSYLRYLARSNSSAQIGFALGASCCALGLGHKGDLRLRPACT